MGGGEERKRGGMLNGRDAIQYASESHINNTFRCCGGPLNPGGVGM